MGSAVGSADGSIVGVAVGDCTVGVEVGDGVGSKEGAFDGEAVGVRVGFAVGRGVGERVGFGVGLAEGPFVGAINGEILDSPHCPSQLSIEAESASTSRSEQLELSAHETEQDPVPQRMRVFPLHESAPSQYTVTAVAADPSMTVLPSHELSPSQCTSQASPSRQTKVLSLQMSLLLHLRSGRGHRQCDDESVSIEYLRESTNQKRGMWS